MDRQGTFILPGTTEGFPVEGTWALGFEVCVGVQEAEHAQRASWAEPALRASALRCWGSRGHPGRTCHQASSGPFCLWDPEHRTNGGQRTVCPKVYKLLIKLTTC